MKNRERLKAVSQAAQVWNLEKLESRRLMSGASVQDGILIITGTGSDDRIELERALDGRIVGEGIWVYGYTNDPAVPDGLFLADLFPVAGLRGIRIDTGAGNDRVVVHDDVNDANFTTPMTLIGGEGDDSLQGGAGDDVLIGGPGDNLLDGQGGNNTLDGPRSPLASAHLVNGLLTVTGTRKDDVIEIRYQPWHPYSQYELYINGEDFDIELRGTRRVMIEGGDGNDLIYLDSTHFSSTVYGGAGDDTIIGSANTDSLFGGSGRDLLVADTTNTDFPYLWQYYGEVWKNGAPYRYDPEQLVQRTDGGNRFYDGAGNDILDGDGPDRWIAPAPAPAPAPVPAPTPLPDSGNSTAPALEPSATASLPIPSPVQVFTPFAINPLLVSDDQLWDA